MRTIELTDFEAGAITDGRLSQIRRDLDPQPTEASNGSLQWNGVLFWDYPQLLLDRCPFGTPGSVFRVSNAGWGWADFADHTVVSVRVERVRSITDVDLLACGTTAGKALYHRWCLDTDNDDPERWQWVVDFAETEADNGGQ